MSKIGLFKGAKEALKKLKKQGKLLAIATSKYRSGLEQILSRFELTELFSTSKCGDEGSPKPNPGMIWSILDELKIDHENAVMIGDTEYDMQLAQNAGVDAMAVTYGVQTKDRLKSYKPVICVDDIRQLPKLFNKAV